MKPSDYTQSWTPEEKDRVVAVFEWLLKEDKKQHPENYPNIGKDTLEGETNHTEVLN